MVCGEVADVDASIGPLNGLKSDAGALEGLVDDLEQLALLRVHILRLEVVDAEESILESADIVVEEVASRRINCAEMVGVFVVEGFGIVS